jgi:hypothetical protein
MAGWDTANGTSVTATDRLRAALLGRRRRSATPDDAAPERTPEASSSLTEERLRSVSDYLSATPDEPLKRAAG